MDTTRGNAVTRRRLVVFEGSCPLLFSLDVDDVCRHCAPIVYVRPFYGAQGKLLLAVKKQNTTGDSESRLWPGKAHKLNGIR